LNRLFYWDAREVEGFCVRMRQGESCVLRKQDYDAPLNALLGVLKEAAF